MAGWMALERAEVTWFLSTDSSDLPFEPKPGSQDDVPVDHR